MNLGVEGGYDVMRQIGCFEVALGLQGMNAVNSEVGSQRHKRQHTDQNQSNQE